MFYKWRAFSRRLYTAANGIRTIGKMHLTLFLLYHREWLIINESLKSIQNCMQAIERRKGYLIWPCLDWSFQQHYFLHWHKETDIQMVLVTILFDNHFLILKLLAFAKIWITSWKQGRYEKYFNCFKGSRWNEYVLSLMRHLTHVNSLFSRFKWYVLIWF